MCHHKYDFVFFNGLKTNLHITALLSSAHLSQVGGFSVLCIFFDVQMNERSIFVCISQYKVYKIS